MGQGCWIPEKKCMVQGPPLVARNMPQPGATRVGVRPEGDPPVVVLAHIAAAYDEPELIRIIRL